MAADIDFEYEQISDFERLVTLTLDWVIQQTAVQHSLTSAGCTQILETYGK